jgi:DUF4097 and DUF4098 domain-containing protein YvlB
MKKLILGLVQWFVFLTAGSCGAAMASGQAVSESREASPDGIVRVTVVRGRVRIEGWSENRIIVDGRLDEEMKEFILDVGKGDATIEVRLPHAMRSWCCSQGSDLVIRVPQGSQLDVSGVSTDFAMEGIQGGVEVGGVSGNISARLIGRRVNITSVSGNIKLQEAKGRIELKSVSGNILTEHAEGDIRLRSVSGNLVARRASPELDIETVSGDVGVSGGSYRSLSGQAVSGNADIAGELMPGGRMDYESVSGTIRVSLLNPLDVRFDLASGTGAIRNRITDQKPERSKYNRGQALRFVVGEGTGTVVLRNHSGDITVEP